MGRSQAGKSWTEERIGANLFQNFEKVNTSSPKAPYYEAMENPQCFANKIVMFDEFADQSEELQNQIKAFTSQGVTTAVLKTVDIKRNFLKTTIDGLPTTWTNSAAPLDDEQLLNRFWKINIDESPVQDKQVQIYQKQEEKFGNSLERNNELIGQARSEISTILGVTNIEVLNPFAEFWNVKFPSMRNIRPMITAIIKVIAYSNRIVRTHVDDNIILASLADNVIGFYIWSFYEIFQLRKVPDRYLKLLNALKSGEKYTKKELSEAFSKKYPQISALSPDSCYTYARYLEKHDLMGSEEDGREKL